MYIMYIVITVYTCTVVHVHVHVHDYMYMYTIIVPVQHVCHRICSQGISLSHTLTRSNHQVLDQRSDSFDC